MKTIWVQGLKGTDLQYMKENVLGSKKVLDKAIEIIYTYIKSGEKTKLEDFDSPSWALRQAFLAGERSAYTQMIEVLTVDEEK